MIFLLDLHLEGQSRLILGTLAADGWLDLLPIRLVTLAEAGLPHDSSDRTIWRFAQANQMLLITGNRNMKGPDSLGQTILDENNAGSYPVLTIGSVERLDNPEYRRRCCARLIEIALDLESYLGTGRLFVP
jgi:Domain of unknown function (DUF5615)